MRNKAVPNIPDLASQLMEKLTGLKESDFRILCLSGGGFLGLFTAAFLAELEQ